MTIRLWTGIALAAAMLAVGCTQDATASAGAAASPIAAEAGPVAAAAPVATVGALDAGAPSSADASGQPETGAAADAFDPASLPPFPFFKAPEGLQSGLDECEKKGSGSFIAKKGVRFIY